MDARAIEDLFSSFARVRAQRMFGGYGVYVEDACIALSVMGDFWLKADASMVSALKEAGSTPFQYGKSKGRLVTVNAFWRLPDGALDDEEELARWLRPALAAAQATAAIKTRAKIRSAQLESKLPNK